MKSARFWVVVLLLCSALLIRFRRGDTDYVPSSTPLAELPQQLGTWSSTEIPMEQATLDILGKGVFLNRIYKPAGTLLSQDTEQTAAQAQSQAPVSLFIGYFPTQRSGQSIHSPQHCLPGAGWVFESSGTTTVQGANGKPLEVGDYVISNGEHKAEVLYWYQSEGQSIANDYQAKIFMLANSIRFNRTDAALVRVLTPVLPGESRQASHARLLAFANLVSPLLPAYIPN